MGSALALTCPPVHNEVADQPAQGSDGTGRIARATRARLGVDARALAVLRILLGLLLLIDIAYRLPDRVAFYTDHGLLPRETLHVLRPNPLPLPHTWSGEVWWLELLLGLQALLAAALVIGYRTRVVTVASFLFLFSLHARNPFVLNAGDSILRSLLFWSMFLPLGARWSLDARGRTPARRWLADAATAGILVQVVLVYTLNVIQKVRAGSWSDGEALLYVFQTTRYLSPLGHAVAPLEAPLRAAGAAWFLLLLLSPLLLLATGWTRTLLAACFASAHLAMFVLMRVGWFPLVSIAALVPFVATPAWDALERHVVVPLQKRMGGAQAVVAPRPPGTLLAAVRRWRSLLPSMFLVWLLVSATVTAGLVTPPPDAAGLLDDRRWDMFAEPGRANRWIAAPAELASGRHIDALHMDEEEWTQDRAVPEPYPGFRWRKYLDGIVRPEREALLAPFAAFLCTRWNGAHDDAMVQVQILRVDQEIILGGEDPPPVHWELAQHTCS